MKKRSLMSLILEFVPLIYLGATFVSGIMLVCFDKWIEVPFFDAILNFCDMFHMYRWSNTLEWIIIGVCVHLLLTSCYLFENYRSKKWTSKKF